MFVLMCVRDRRFYLCFGVLKLVCEVSMQERSTKNCRFLLFCGYVGFLSCSVLLPEVIATGALTKPSTRLDQFELLFPIQFNKAYQHTPLIFFNISGFSCKKRLS